jgi:hypothetical protein
MTGVPLTLPNGRLSPSWVRPFIYEINTWFHTPAAHKHTVDPYSLPWPDCYYMQVGAVVSILYGAKKENSRGFQLIWG